MLKRLWNADFRSYNLPDLSLLWVVVAIAFTWFEMHSALLVDFSKLFSEWLGQDEGRENLGYVFTLIFALFACYVVVLVLVHEKVSYRKLGKKSLNAITFPHFLVTVIDLVLTLLVILILEKLFILVFGLDVNLSSLMGVDGPDHPFQGLIDFYNTHIPTYIELPYLIAIPVIFICADFPIYVAHYLTHKSRFLWLVVHRSHHSPAYLTPFGNGPVFAFGLLIAIPYFLATLALSKLIYTEPLVLEVMVIQLVYAVTEKFNHTSAFYDFSSRHRWLFSFFGNGPYHYTHHSAREGEEIVNIANICFNFWDRVFGTFKKPEATKPPVGLTHQPEIVLNPFRLYLGGIATILYELKHNSPRHWFKILFGSVYYTPPKSKDFLIISYPGPKLYPL